MVDRLDYAIYFSEKVIDLTSKCILKIDNELEIATIISMLKILLSIQSPNELVLIFQSAKLVDKFLPVILQLYEFIEKKSLSTDPNQEEIESHKILADCIIQLIDFTIIVLYFI